MKLSRGRQAGAYSYAAFGGLHISDAMIVAGALAASEWDSLGGFEYLGAGDLARRVFVAMAAVSCKDRALSKSQKKAYDDPEADATDGAHPAWWRGNDAGVDGAVRRVNEALDTSETLCLGSPDLQKLCERVRALQGECSVAQASAVRMRRAVVRARNWMREALGMNDGSFLTNDASRKQNCKDAHQVLEEALAASGHGGQDV